MTTIAFIRHGITKWNKEGRMQGSIDIPLSEEGIQMAKGLSEQLAAGEWHVIYSSPMKRAKMTAAIIASELRLPNVVEDNRIREIHEGEIEGTTEDERLNKWGSSWRTLFLGREKDIEVLKRGVSFIEDIKEKYPNGKILVISHGSFIKKIIQQLCPSETFIEEPENASICIITLKEVNRCIVYNCMNPSTDIHIKYGNPHPNNGQSFSEIPSN